MTNERLLLLCRKLSIVISFSYGTFANENCTKSL